MDTVVPFVPKNTPMFSTKSAYNKLTNHNRDIIYVEDLYLDKHFAKVDMETWWPMSCTVGVFMLELAIYMGYEEIILLGQDCTYTCQDKNTSHVGDSYNDSKYKELLSVEQTRVLERGMTFDEFDEHIFNMINEDFKGVKKYADKHNIKIINATRGGRLEVFERKTLDDILNDD